MIFFSQFSPKTEQSTTLFKITITNELLEVITQLYIITGKEKKNNIDSFNKMTHGFAKSTTKPISFSAERKLMRNFVRASFLAVDHILREND